MSSSSNSRISGKSKHGRQRSSTGNDKHRDVQGRERDLDGTDQTPNEDDDDENSRTDSSVSTSEGEEDVVAEDNARKKKRLYQYSVPTRTTQKQGVERTDNVDDDESIQQPIHKEAPSSLWKTIDASMKQVKVEKTAVHEFVANYLFPKLKFVRGTAVVNMEYSTDTKSLCALAMAGCHQEHSAEGMIWWAIARKQTIQEIKRLRNDASKNLKTAFLGKLLTERMYLLSRCCSHIYLLRQST